MHQGAKLYATVLFILYVQHDLYKKLPLFGDIFTEATRKRAFNLVARAYSCISVEDFCAFVGMAASDAIDGMCLWTYFVYFISSQLHIMQFHTT